MRNRLILLLAALAALLLLSGCKVSGHPLPEGMEEDAVLEQGREIVTLLNQGDFQEVYDRLRSDAREGASLETFQAAVNQNLGKAGAYVKEDDALATGQTIKDSGEEYGTAVLYCKHEKKSIMYRVAFSTGMELMGVEVKVQ